MILATAETANFCFQTLAASTEEANAQLLAAWRRHAREYRHAEPGYMAEMIEDGSVTYTALALGQTIRDGEVLS